MVTYSGHFYLINVKIKKEKKLAERENADFFLQTGSETLLFIIPLFVFRSMLSQVNIPANIYHLILSHAYSTENVSQL